MCCANPRVVVPKRGSRRFDAWREVRADRGLQPDFAGPHRAGVVQGRGRVIFFEGPVVDTLGSHEFAGSGEKL